MDDGTKVELKEFIESHLTYLEDKILHVEDAAKLRVAVVDVRLDAISIQLGRFVTRSELVAALVAVFTAIAAVGAFFAFHYK
jgi:hypothetical protein